MILPPMCLSLHSSWVKMPWLVDRTRWPNCLEGRMLLVHFSNSGDEDIVSGGDDSALVDSADELNHDLLASVVIDDLELTDVLVLLHDSQEFDQHLGDWSQLNLLLALAFSVDDGLESIS
jgi:hypothetical protein